MRPWSYSRLKCYETCPKQYSYKYVEKLAGSRPSSPAATRGSEIHEKAEKYLLDELHIYPPELQKVAGHAMKIKALKAKPEAKLAVREDWSPCEYEAADVYLRAIIDILIPGEEQVHIQDWKTGKEYPEHKDQMTLYANIAAAHYPAKEYITQLVYIDQGFVTSPKATPTERIKGTRIMLDGRIKIAEKDEILPAKPNAMCKWCEYSQRHGGPCTSG